MSFDPSIFFAAFEAAGFMKSAAFTLASGTHYPSVTVGFIRPDEPTLSGRALTSEYEIEFETAAAAGLSHGDTAVIDGDTYKLREDPRTKGDGTFSKVLLNRQ